MFSTRPPVIVSVVCGHDRADHRVLHRDPREPRHVARARVVAGRVEPVRVREVRVAQTELPRLGVHHRDEARLGPADVLGERDRGVVRALDQRRLDELAHRQPLAGRR